MAGRRPVEEAFAARRPAIRLLVTPGRRAALERIVLHATTLRIPIVEVEGGTLTSISGFDGHQGVALVVEPRRFATLDEVLARSIERGEPPFVLVLDSLEDPQNLGTVLRSAEAAGVHGVLFPTARQAPLSPAAIKASAGATEHLLLCPVDDLPQALADLHVRGLRIVGSEAEAPLSARQGDLRGPLAIVIGSEGQGLTPAVRRRCDTMVRIPMRGSIGSLNAAVAGSILLFEALGQRDPEARPDIATGPAVEATPRSRRRSAPEPDDDELVVERPVEAAAAVQPDEVELLPGGPPPTADRELPEAAPDPTPAVEAAPRPKRRRVTTAAAAPPPDPTPVAAPLPGPKRRRATTAAAAPPAAEPPAPAGDDPAPAGEVAQPAPRPKRRRTASA
ncbi:MAG: 23S rRNA (guanosine(2251)-2'-O)-methyltransferase RlmB [Chloroflexi bacterium]|nr:23S rRNA (guanosine(2251)-2'-O)-methyltransferase RlmB [Chloroflexota bacterium]